MVSAATRLSQQRPGRASFAPSHTQSSPSRRAPRRASSSSSPRNQDNCTLVWLNELEVFHYQWLQELNFKSAQ